ncbi:sensor histidine kinase [Deinococcus altitudinis]|uniref:sensor histidine kinase n=1 Tax=Deinococcus altitudinis TaxID=468914 RepID=UPI003891EE09
MSQDTLKLQPEVEAEASLSLEARFKSLEAQVLQLQSALNQARPLFQNSPGASFLLNRQGRVLDVNMRGADLLRSTREVLTGRSLLPLLAPGSQGTLTALLARVAEGRGQQAGEIQLQRPDGGVLELAVELAAHEGSGESVLLHLTLTDVTAFKLAHRALWSTQQAQELELQEMIVRLRQLYEEFENVVLVSGREMKSLITRAENFMVLSQRHPETPGHLDHVEEALQQTRNLLESLKDYMQIRFLRTRLRSVSLAQVLHEVLKDVHDQISDREVWITNDALPTLNGDSQVLKIIMREYLSNALKFTRTRPQIRIHVVVQEDATEYRIGMEDNGIGFSMRQKKKAFELFGRLHSSSLYEGTGLGLAVVRRLCERFGGRAWGEGKVNQGATFWFAWPKTPEQQ